MINPRPVRTFIRADRTSRNPICVTRALVISVCLLALESGLLAAATSASFYPERPDDPAAVHVSAVADGIADDTAAVQDAINRVVQTTTRGIVFVPSGTYRLTRPVTIWPGIRVIGYGPTRPRFTLADHTPGYQGAPAYLFHFAGNIPGHPTGSGYVFQPAAPKPLIDFSEPARDANPGTFYSALSNVDIALGEGNPGAVAVRATFAQHCFLAHIDFDLGSGLAGIHDGGNVGEDLRFFGGRHGIITRTPSPGWQFVLIDTVFEGQSVSAIQSEASGLTLIRPSFKNVPTAVSMSPERGEQLWIKDGRLDDITGPAFLVGNEHNARNQINLQNVVCRRTPVFARFLESGREIPAPSPLYRVAEFSHGLHVSGGGDRAADFVTETRPRFAPLADFPPPVPSDLAPLPPQSTWVNVRSLGLKGDGVADDTDALRQAIAAHRTLYFPSGAYRITDTLTLRPDTVLVGLNAGTTRLFIADATPAFQGLGPPVPMIEAPSGGANILSGFGIYTNGNNPRAVAVKWMSGEHSLIHDVRFLGGHGTARLSGEREPLYNQNNTADPDPLRRWDSQYPSLWVTDGGGGTFVDIWTPSPYAQAGLLVSRTSTPGRIYALSVEHHVRNEVVFRDVANWEIYALQLEEERGESGAALPLSFERCRNLTVANLFSYRVISSFQPFTTAVALADCAGIRFRNVHIWTNSRANFDHAIIDPALGLALRQHEFASFDSPSAPVPAPAAGTPRVKKLSGGFVRLAGGAADRAGRFYAVDPLRHAIYRWKTPGSPAELVADAPLQPVNLACDDSGNLLVVSHVGSVYSFNPDKPADPVRVLAPEPVAARPGSRAVLPVNYWTNGLPLVRGELPPDAAHFVSPDGSVFIPAHPDFISGKLSWGVRDHDLLRAYGLAPVAPGRPVFVTLEVDGRTYSAASDAAGRPGAFKLFAHRGGEAVATDSDGNVYIAEGHVFVYAPDGRLLEVIPMPERPLGLVFGGPDGRTLFIPAGTSLYTWRRD